MALPLYFRLTVSCIDGALVDYELHAWSHEGHGVVWELRRVLDGVLGADHGHKLHEWLKPPRGQRFLGIFKFAGWSGMLNLRQADRHCRLAYGWIVGTQRRS